MYNKRLYYNLKILFKLLIYFFKYPSARFNQALVNLNINKIVEFSSSGDGCMENPNIAIKDEFYLESKDLDKRVML